MKSLSMMKCILLLRPFMIGNIGLQEEVVETSDDSSRALNQILYFDMNITMNICT